jgi:hypothetical protein
VDTATRVYLVENGLNPAPYSIEVNHDVEIDHYIITLKMLGKKFSRIEKTERRAVLYAKEMNDLIEQTFQYTWEDNT